MKHPHQAKLQLPVFLPLYYARQVTSFHCFNNKHVLGKNTRIQHFYILFSLSKVSQTDWLDVLLLFILPYVIFPFRPFTLQTPLLPLKLHNIQNPYLVDYANILESFTVWQASLPYA